MLRILNWILALESLRPSRRDDEFTAEWKAARREALAATVQMVLALGLGLLASHLFSSALSHPIFVAAAASAATPVLYLCLAVLLIVFVRMCVALWNLYRFARDHDVY